MSSPRPVAALRAVGISHSYGDRRVLADLGFLAPPGARIGLLGENGAGKSTLLRVLAGAERPERGVVERPARTVLLEQEVSAPATAPLASIVERALAPLRAVERELEEAAASLGRDPDADDRYARALEDAERLELWSIDARRDELLDGLGVGALELSRPISTVSGGQRSRVALAALLLARPEALLLDEPTNHLDDHAAEYLARVLRGWGGVVVFASHDRAFLDEVATELVDIDPARGGATRFGGSFSDYLLAKAGERRRWEEQHELEQAEEARLESVVAVTGRQVAPGRGPRDNDKFIHRFKGANVDRQVARRVRDARGRLDELRSSRVAPPPPPLEFAGIPRGSHALESEGPVLTLSGARVDGRLDLVSLAISSRDRLLLTGANGAGKSTLLGALAGTVALDAGEIRRRPGLRVATLVQDVRWADPSESPRTLYGRHVGDAAAERRPLGGLGLLAHRDLDRPVGSLSVGQQRRVALALAIARPPHLFLLDEPSNHLSVTLATELEEALGSYPGAIVVASHDRWLRSRWRGRSVHLEAGHRVDDD